MALPGAKIFQTVYIHTCTIVSSSTQRVKIVMIGTQRGNRHKCQILIDQYSLNQYNDYIVIQTPHEESFHSSTNMPIQWYLL